MNGQAIQILANNINFHANMLLITNNQNYTTYNFNPCINTFIIIVTCTYL